MTRKEGERIKIGEGITILVAQIKDGVVRIGIDAPKDISIYRNEIYSIINRKGEQDEPLAS